MDRSVGGTVAPDGVWMLVGKDGKTAQVPFDVTEDVMQLNPHNKAAMAPVSLPHNLGFAIHPHWIQERNHVKLLSPVYVFFQQPVAQLQPDDRLSDPTNEKTYGNAYGMYRA